jgi:hypothetical protein
MKTRTILSVALVLICFALPAGAAPQPAPELTSAGGGAGEPAPPANPGAVLWNQPTSDTGGSASQYMPDYDGGFYSADDFQNTEAWALDLIFIDGSWNGGGSLPDAASLNWYIYADAGGVPAGHPEDGGGTEVWSYSCAPGAPEVTLSGAFNDDATLDIVLAQGTQLVLPPGHWWLVFFPSLDYGLYNQWWWERAGTANLVDAQVIDPNNLFGYGWFTWTSWYNVGDPGVTYDLAFRLEGNDPTAVTVRDFAARTSRAPLAALGVLAGAVAVAGVFLLKRRP